MDMQWFENPLYIGILAGALTSVSMLPQLVKLVKEKDAGQISIGMLLLLIAGLSAWVYYGVIKKDAPVLVTNAVAIVINVANLVLTLRYKRRGR